MIVPEEWSGGDYGKRMEQQEREEKQRSGKIRKEMENSKLRGKWEDEV